MNPEITNWVPVLKSYWLVIHVAIITSSYGFLAMGAILGFLNLTLMVARNKNNYKRLNSNIQEISYIIELALIIGLFMLTIGTFIGGIWANESGVVTGVGMPKKHGRLLVYWFMPLYFTFV